MLDRGFVEDARLVQIEIALVDFESILEIIVKIVGEIIGGIGDVAEVTEVIFELR